MKLEEENEDLVVHLQYSPRSQGDKQKSERKDAEGNKKNKFKNEENKELIELRNRIQKRIEKQ